MQRDICVWISILCVCSMWVGSTVYFTLNTGEKLLRSLADIESSNTEMVANESRDIRNKISALYGKVDKVEHLVNKVKGLIPTKPLVVNKDGCVLTECLARLLLMVSDLRRAFALGAMSKDAIYAVKPMLLELKDQEIDASLLILESFDTEKNYTTLRKELDTVKSALRFNKSVAMPKYLSKWVSVEDRNNAIWQDFTKLESLVGKGAWSDAYRLVSSGSFLSENSDQGSMSVVRSWMQDLEEVLEAEECISLIYNKLIERVNKNPEGL